VSFVSLSPHQQNDDGGYHHSCIEKRQQAWNGYTTMAKATTTFQPVCQKMVRGGPGARSLKHAKR